MTGRILSVFFGLLFCATHNPQAGGISSIDFNRNQLGILEETSGSIPAPTPTPYGESESPIGVPLSHWPAPPVNFNDDRFDVNVHAFGRLWFSVFAVHPKTSELFFTDFKNDYYCTEAFEANKMTEQERNELTRRHLYRIPEDSFRTHIHSILPYAEMPLTDRSYTEHRDMEIDSEGNVWFLSRNRIIRIQSDLSSRVIYSSAGNSLSAIRIAWKAIPRYGIQENSLLVLSKVGNSQSSILLLSPSGNGEYETAELLTGSKNDIIDFAFGPDDILYFIEYNSAGLYTLLENGEIQHIGQDLSSAVSRECRLVYLSATQTFFTVPLNGRRIYEINHDGSLIKVHEIDPVAFYQTHYVNPIIHDIAVSPEGDALLLLIDYGPHDYGSFDYGSIQSLRYIVDRVKELEAGDFNSDGVFDRADMDDLLDVFLTSKNLRATEMKYMDLNGDGVISPQDVQDLWVKMHQE